MPLNTNDPTQPDYVRPEVIEAAPDLTLIANLIDGPRAMWTGTDTRGPYIRKWRDEPDATYALRRHCEPCEGLFGRTLSASVGKLFAKPPRLEYAGAEDVLRAHWDNIDGAGTKGDVAAKEFAADGLADGFALILVDHAKAPEGTVVTAEREASLGLRPTWAFYDRAAVCSWRTVVQNNAETLAQVVLREAVEEGAGRFGVTTATHFRELFVTNGIAGWRLYRAVESAGATTFVVQSEGTFRDKAGNTRDTIPLAVGYTGRRQSAFVADPPLRDVAYANLAHWRIATELTFGSQVSAIEQPLVKGALMADAVSGQPQKVKLGWLNLINVEAGGDFEWRGPSGAGLAQLKERKIEKEQSIAAMGLSFMSRDTRAAETAEAKRLDAAAENSTLATAGQGIEDAINLAWEYHGWYMGLEKTECPRVTLNRDYDSTILTPQQAQAIAALIGAGMPIRLAVATLVTGGFLKADESEIDEIVLEWEAGIADQQAREDEARQAAADRMQQQNGPPDERAA